MQKIIRIRNLDCANCAREMEEELAEIKGLSAVSVDFINQRVQFECAGEEALKKAIYLISHFEEVEIIDENAPQKKDRRLKEIVSIVLSAAFFVPALILQLLGGFNEWLVFALFLGAFAAAGWSVVFSVVKNIPRAFQGGFHGGVLLDENLLMLIASIGAFCIRQDMEGAAVMLLYQIGELLQSIAVGSSRNAIAKLVRLKSQSATLMCEEEMREVDAALLQAGDEILLRRGDRVPADCLLVEGETVLDTKSLTGEAVLREVRAGEELLAGCVNEGNAVKAKVVRPSSESAVAKILNVVESASANKAKPEKFITKFARYYTPIVVLLAVLIAFVPPIFYGYTAVAFRRWLVSALNFLVISCPCALIISVPLTYFSGVGALAKAGVLCKGATYLDTLAEVSVAAFDKTGTLTEGTFSVICVHGEERALHLAAAIEYNSSHPLAQAFAQRETHLKAQTVEEVAGMGLAATVEGKRVLVGSERLMQKYGVSFAPVQTLSSVIYVAEEGKLVGAIEIEDRAKEDAKEALSALKELGVKKTVMLTGDSEERAAALASSLGIDEAHARLLPEQKLECANKLKEEGVLLYAGDGINDTPVMATSDVALSMGTLGSDAAIEASDMVLVSDSLSALPKAMRTAKKTKKIVFENIVFSIGVKVALMVLSLMGMLPLWLAVFGDVGVMLLAVCNSFRMRARIK